MGQLGVATLKRISGRAWFHMIVISAVFHSSRAVDVGSAVSGDLECKYACLNWVTSCSFKPATGEKVTSRPADG